MLPRQGQSSGRFWISAVAALLTIALPAKSVVFLSTDDPDFNTTPPTGDLRDSGWQWQGNWRGFGGTVIAPNLFLTAQHVGGAVGDVFVFDGRPYPTLASFADPQSDLMIWKVCGEFPLSAPLYEGSTEVGAACVVFGHGLRRGEAVTVAGGVNPGLRGWRWGANDGRLRWGENTIAGVETGSRGGEQLKALFDQGAGPNEAMLAGGDSGSGLFLREGGQWKLAGVNFAVDGPFRQVGSSEAFSAALFDKRRLLEFGANSRWTLVPDDDVPVPAAFYATRVSARLAWIRSVIAAESARETPPVVEAAALPEGPFIELAPVVADGAERLLIVPLPSANQYFRLRHCRAVTIISIDLVPGAIELRWE
ncbi:MAG: hypothetical protein IPM17_13970 [Verrucomicrobia bacterium]|jgi:hypothetical protein|nr:hypothetical protein [Verrucomicrobiota bacterium]